MTEQLVLSAIKSIFVQVRLISGDCLLEDFTPHQCQRVWFPETELLGDLAVGHWHPGKL